MKLNNLTLFFLLIMLLSGLFEKAIFVLIIVIFHELGHVFIIKILGYKVKEIEIFPFGGITKVDKLLNDHIINDLLIAIFGIIFQLFLSFLWQINIIKNPEFNSLNTAIMLFNLLPIIPLDGSKIVFEILNYFTSYQKALKIYIIISIMSIGVYFFLNYHYMLNNYLIIFLFLYKTYEEFKTRKLYLSKFLLERRLYNIKYRKIYNKNEKLTNYHKDVKYYYFQKGHLFDEKSFLKKHQ